MIAYISSAAGAVFLTVIASMVVPNGKLHKSIMFVLRLACICILIWPVFSIFDIKPADRDSQLVDYEFICGIYEESQSAQLESMIEEQLGIKCDCSVSVIYEDGSFRENGVTIFTDNVESHLIDDMQSYLKELGYINININEKVA